MITNEESRSVPCSTCGAQPGEFCKTSNGNIAVSAHSNRWYKVREQLPAERPKPQLYVGTIDYSGDAVAFVEILKAFPTRTVGEIENLLRAANRFMNGSSFFNQEGDKR